MPRQGDYERHVRVALRARRRVAGPKRALQLFRRREAGRDAVACAVGALRRTALRFVVGFLAATLRFLGAVATFDVAVLRFLLRLGAAFAAVTFGAAALRFFLRLGAAFAAAVVFFVALRATRFFAGEALRFVLRLGAAAFFVADTFFETRRFVVRRAEVDALRRL